MQISQAVALLNPPMDYHFSICPLIKKSIVQNSIEGDYLVVLS